MQGEQIWFLRVNTLTFWGIDRILQKAAKTHDLAALIKVHTWHLPELFQVVGFSVQASIL